MAAFRIKEKEIRLHYYGRCSGLLFNLQIAAENTGSGTKNLVTHLHCHQISHSFLQIKQTAPLSFFVLFVFFIFSLTFCQLFTTYQ